MLVVPILRFCYFGCGDRTARKMCYALVCPHWMLGLAMPFFLGGVVAWTLAVLIPYFRMIRVSAQLCKMERDQPQEQREGVQLQDDAMAALEQVSNTINSRRGRMSRADIWREVDHLHARLSALRGENREAETTVVVQAEAIPESLQGGALGGEVQIARPLDTVRHMGASYQLSFSPRSHFAVVNVEDGTEVAATVASGDTPAMDATQQAIGVTTSADRTRQPASPGP